VARSEEGLTWDLKPIYNLYIMKGEQLRRLRRSLKMTQKGLGEALDLDKNTVARAERDEIPIPRVTELAVKYLLLMKSKKGGSAR